MRKQKIPAVLAAILVLAPIAFAQTPQIASGAPAANVNPPGPPGPPPPPPPPPPNGFGAPLPGLSPGELASWRAGLNQFRFVETPQTGLGPIFNNVSCFACHAQPAPGGSSNIRTTRFGRTTDGVFDPLTALGGTLHHQFALAADLQEVIPPQANTIAQRQTQPLFGLGLVEAIPAGEILQLAARPSVDGVTGRPAMVIDVVSGKTMVGKFGWKAQEATLLGFSADAAINELGVTNRFFPNEIAPNGNTALLRAYEATHPTPEPNDRPDPATGKSGIDRDTDFVRFTAPPPALPPTPSAAAGRAVFQQTGCAVCHVPALTTGQSPSPALNSKVVPLYSDLLLHDMGSLGDGIAQGDASPREMRTAPLWGLRASAPYLHDGRAPTPDAAIRAHDGEAATAVRRYLGLSPTQTRELLDFLNSI